MNEEYNSIERDILRSFYNLRKKILKNPNYYDVISDNWREENSQENLILKSVSKPKLLKRLFCLVTDKNFWAVVNESNLEITKKDMRFFIELIYLFNGLNPRQDLFDELIANFREDINKLEFSLRDKKVNYKLTTDIEEVVNKDREDILSLLKDSREYLEAISVIWKWNEIKKYDKFFDMEELDEGFIVNHFTVHGFHKIIKGKLQSTRNRWSSITNKNKQEKKSVHGNKIHNFLKPHNIYKDSDKKVSTLTTKIINKELEEEGYATSSNWSHFSDCGLAEKVIQLKTSSKKDFQSLIDKIGFNSHKVKILSFGEYAHKDLLPRIQKQLENERPIYKSEPYGFLLSNNNFFWPDSPQSKIYESINELHINEKIIIDKQFLDTRAEIKNCGNIDSFYDTKKKETFIKDKDKRYVSYPDRPFRSLYDESKEDYVKVLEAIDNIEEELRGLDQVIITCPSRSGKKLPYISSLINIIKHIKRFSDDKDTIITTCILVDDIKDMEEELKKKWKEENDESIKEIKKECDSFIRFDRQKFIESRGGNIDLLEQDMRLKGRYSNSYDTGYSDKLINLIDNEIIEILNNILVIYCNKTGIKEYKDFMQGGATVIGKYKIPLKEFKKIKVEKKIEELYDYLLYDSYNQLGEYNSYGRLMISSSFNPIDNEIRKKLEQAKIFGNNSSNCFVNNSAFREDDNYLTLTFLQT